MGPVSAFFGMKSVDEAAEPDVFVGLLELPLILLLSEVTCRSCITYVL